MNSQTSLVAEQVRLQEWSELIRSCQSRPDDMKIETWCQQNGLTKANYYYRLRRVREVCLNRLQSNDPKFIELPVPSAGTQVTNVSKTVYSHEKPSAILHGPKNISVELFSTATTDFLSSLIGALAHVK